MDQHNPYFGVIEDTTKETDYQLVCGALELPRARGVFNNKKITYEQNEVSAVSCTLHGAIGAYSDLVDIPFTLEARKLLWEKALTLGADESVGWYIDDAIDLVRKEANLVSKEDEEVITFRVGVGQSDMQDALELGYSVVTGYRGNKDYNNDFLDDGILDGADFHAFTYAHCIRITKDQDTGLYDIIVDNYPSRSYNTYKISWENLVKLQMNGVFFSSGYVFVVKADYIQMKQPENLVSIWARASVDKAVKKGIMTQWENPQEVIAQANSTLEYSLFNFGGLTKTGMPVTKERLAVAYDRLGLLE